MMKKNLSTFFIALLAVVSLRGAEMPVERLFVSTDREAYIAGDNVWCSLFCLDGEGKRSSQSAVSYLELISAEGTVVEAKIGLLDGRGAGSFRIPVSVPTGVYRLIAYTSANVNEEGTPWMAGSRILTIFNTLSTDRVKGGYKIVDDVTYNSMSRAAQPSAGGLVFNSTARVRKGADVGILIQNGGPPTCRFRSITRMPLFPRRRTIPSPLSSVLYQRALIPNSLGTGLWNMMAKSSQPASPAGWRMSLSSPSPRYHRRERRPIFTSESQTMTGSDS